MNDIFIIPHSHKSTNIFQSSKTIHRIVSGAQSGSTRQIGIPKDITHIAIMCEADDEDSSQNAKLVLAKEMWQYEDSHIERACLFVPTAQDVSKVLGILR